MPTAEQKTTSAQRDSRPRPGHAVGLEFDHLAVRAVRIAVDARGGRSVDAMAEATGDFSQEDELLAGIRQVKDRLRMGARDPVATCLSGKQVSASQIPFRNLPPEEMGPALRLEMRKSVPFEIGGAAFDYQILKEASGAEGMNEVLVGLAGAGMLSQHLKALEKAGLTPAVVDVLPSAVANALWTWVGPPGSDIPFVALHMGPQVSTIVIDGARSPFFNRYMYFAAEDFVGREAGSGDMDKRVQSLADEVSRSLAFYEKNAGTAGYQELLLLGEYLDIPGLQDKLRRQSGLAVKKMDSPRRLGYQHDFPAGRFDLALALAFRAGEEP